MEKVKIKLEVQYNGHSIKKNGSVDLRFKSPYSELTNSVNLLRLINCNIGLKARVNQGNSFDLGVFYLQKLSIDHDGESTIIFNSEIDNVELAKLNDLTEQEIIIRLMCVGNIEDENEDIE